MALKLLLFLNISLLLNDKSELLSISIVILATSLTISTVDTIVNAISSLILVDGNKIFKSDGKNQKNFQKTVKKSKNIKISSYAIKEFRNNFFLGKKFDYPVSVLDLLFLKGPESGYFINNY